MLTDDDLTRELSAAFHDETDGLAYAGKVPTLRRRVPLSSLPIAAAAAAIVIVPQVTGDEQAAPHPSHPTASASTSASRPPTSASTTAAPVGTLHKVHLAGFTFETTKKVSPEDPLLFSLGVPVPDDATVVTGVPDAIKAWVGTDPKTGYPAVWVRSEFDDGPTTWEVYSFHNDWTADELVDLVTSPVTS